MDGKDFRVCNLEAVNNFQNNQQVRASFIRIQECKGSARDAIVCMMLHKNEGWIEVKEIH
jgi:hypothetical protein